MLVLPLDFGAVLPASAPLFLARRESTSAELKETAAPITYQSASIGSVAHLLRLSNILLAQGHQDFTDLVFSLRYLPTSYFAQRATQDPTSPPLRQPAASSLDTSWGICATWTFCSSALRNYHDQLPQPILLSALEIYPLGVDTLNPLYLPTSHPIFRSCAAAQFNPPRNPLPHIKSNQFPSTIRLRNCWGKQPNSFYGTTPFCFPKDAATDAQPRDGDEETYLAAGDTPSRFSCFYSCQRRQWPGIARCKGRGPF